MLEKYINKAETLLEALPYIQKFSGQTVVIKYGGSAMEDESLQKFVATDIVLLKYVGINPVIIHGGGAEVTKWLDKVHIETEFINGHRKTTPESLEIIEMVLAGKVNKAIAHLINHAGGKAVGLSGKDAGLIEVTKHKDENLGLVGEIKKVNTNIISVLQKESYIPVISSIGFDTKGDSFNINADFVATEIAIALKAEKFILLTNVAGILDTESNVIKKVSIDEIKNKIADGTINSGMIPKADAAIKAIQNGVQNAHIINGKTPHSILLELFTNYGIGTMVSHK